MINLDKLIKENPAIISTCAESNPNIAIASDIALIDDKTIIISHNEMIRTVENIITNSNISLLIVDPKAGWGGVRVFGKARYHQDGEYFNKVCELFKNETTRPIGVIVVRIDDVREIA